MNKDYRKEQRLAEQAYKNRGTVRWVSCQIVQMPRLGQDGKPMTDKDGKPDLIRFKKPVQGTYRRNTSPRLTKAEKKLERKKDHTKRHYFQQRQLTAKARKRIIAYVERMLELADASEN